MSDPMAMAVIQRERNELVVALETARESISDLLARLAEAERERDEARKLAEEACARYNALIVEGPTLTCAFCSTSYPTGTPPTQHEALTAHIRECPKHPLRQELINTTDERDALWAIVERLQLLLPDIQLGETNATALAWHLEDGKDNAGIGQVPLAKWLHGQAEMCHQIKTAIKES